MFQIKIIENGKVTYSVHVEEEYEAKESFFSCVDNMISNFDEYSQCDREAIFEQGYERTNDSKVTVEEI